MKFIRCVFITVFLFAVIAIPAADKTGNVIQLIVLHTNDTHGHPVKFANSPADGAGGLPARATLVKEIRSRYENVLVLDAGDINTGRPESNFFKAEPDIIGYNYIGYDAMALGNHEFDNSADVLKKQMKQAKFPFLSANVKTKDGKNVATPYIIKSFKGLKVAVFGLTTRDTAVMGGPENVKDLVFEDEVKTANELVPKLRKQADIVIALVHLGIYENETEGSRYLAKNVNGIDLIVDGHSHTMLDKPIYVNNTPIVQAWQWGMIVGEGVFTIKNRKIESFEWKAVPVNLKEKVKNSDGKEEIKFVGNQIDEDRTLLEQLSKYPEQVDKLLSEKIGETSDVFPNKEVRLKETALGDLVADSMLWYTKNLGVDFAIQNSGGIRTDLPKGDITKKNVYEIIPFDNSTVVVNLKGSEVKKIFDYIATIAQGKGAFPQVSEGVSFTINYDKGVCEDVLIGGKPIDEEKIYKIATNSFVATGGDGYLPFIKSTDPYDTSKFQRDILIEYIKTMTGKISPDVKNRIKIIGSKLAYIFGFSRYDLS
jgi:5'-nucleotidase / UDP-sugar diphosphatase